MYKVTISTLFINGKKHVRGDMVDITEEQAVPHGTNLELVAVKRKRATRKKKAENSED
jgi:hypothetical protein